MNVGAVRSFACKTNDGAVSCAGTVEVERSGQIQEDLGHGIVGEGSHVRLQGRK